MERSRGRGLCAAGRLECAPAGRQYQGHHFGRHRVVVLARPWPRWQCLIARIRRASAGGPKRMRETSVTQSGATGRTLAASLGAARDELRADVARGAGGRTALERYSDRADVLLRQLFTEAPAPKTPVAVLALGGYGRRHPCLHSDIDLLILFGGTIGP